MRETSRIEIDLGAVSSNMGVLRRLVGPDGVLCPVVKADGYGLGAGRVARCLVGSGAEMLAVYTAGQAAALFNGAVDVPVLVLMPVHDIGRGDDVYRALVCGRLHLSVHGSDHLDHLIGVAERNAAQIPLHLDLDTGLCRGGCDPDEAPAVLARIVASPRVRLAGIYTQFAAADSDPDLTATQHRRFEAFMREHAADIPDDCLVHVANTCATLRSRKFHHRMIRVGQAWAGYGAECVKGGRVLEGATDLRPCVTWTSALAHVRLVPAGTPVGYGATWTTRRPSLIGLVPVGYADGYPLALSAAGEGPGERTSTSTSTSTSKSKSKGKASSPAGKSTAGTRTARARIAVLVETPEGVVRAHAPVVGRISMDQMAVDLTGLKHGRRALTDLIGVGTPVELITPDRDAPNHLVRLAHAAGTLPHAILCGLNPRIRRAYIRSPVSAPSAAPASAPAPAEAPIEVTVRSAVAG